MCAFSTTAMESTSLLLISIVSLLFVASDGLSETESLLKFKKSLVIGGASGLDSWNRKNPPCKWFGILCDQGYVWGLRLENIELAGSLDIEALTGLKSLRSLSFMNNKLRGPFPNFKKLGALKSIYLSNNQFDVLIPKDAFDGMGWLKKIHLEHNKFNGEIPVSVAKIPKLLELRLDGNQFTGQIPEFTHKLHILNFSDNALSGPIPNILRTMDPKLFEGSIIFVFPLRHGVMFLCIRLTNNDLLAGNKKLCGKPLLTECYSPCNLSEEPKASSKKKTSKFLYIVAAVVAVILALLIILGLIIVLCRRRRNNQPLMSPDSGSSSLQKRAGIQKGDKGQYCCHSKKRVAKRMIHTTKLSFLRDDKGNFDLQDLLKSSAEIMGSGCFGASYKTLLSNGSMMVVKRFKHMESAGSEEFQDNMKRLGRLNHENLLPIVAYCYKKEEKLFVSDFIDNGSLADTLHGNIWVFSIHINTNKISFP